jgi:hypothetical protein
LGSVWKRKDTVLFAASLELEFCHPAGRVAISHRMKLDQQKTWERFSGEGKLPKLHHETEEACLSENLRRIAAAANSCHF